MDQWAREQIETLSLRVAALERQLAGTPETPASSQPPLSEAVNPEVLEFLRAEKPVQAVKAYMDASGCDMTTAKAAVDRISAQMGF